jgi:hypothetical protein
MSSPEERYNRIAMRGRTRDQVEIVARARGDKELLEFIRSGGGEDVDELMNMME